MSTDTGAALINGVVICSVDESLGEEELRQRACSELLRQAAIKSGLLSAADPVPTGGAMSEAASEAIENLLDAQLQAPDPDEDTCYRFYEGNSHRFSVGERVRARHVLFAVTSGVDVSELRKRAEACLIDLRCDSADGDDRFAAVAAQTSNCPSGSEGGHLGWLMESDCAPEFASELFGKAEVGVLPRLIRSRFGLHVVEVIERQAGSVPTYEKARAAVAQALQRQQFATALRQYLQLLAGQATIIGIDLERSDSALVQ